MLMFSKSWFFVRAWYNLQTSIDYFRITERQKEGCHLGIFRFRQISKAPVHRKFSPCF